MATIKFVTKGNSTLSTIYVRLRDGRKIDFTVSTTLTINPSYWNNEKGTVRQKAEFGDKLNFEKKLDELKGLIESERNNSLSKGQTINKDWLDNLVLKWKGLNTGKDSDLLIERIEQYRDSLNLKVREGKIGVSDGTLRNYNTTAQRLRKFEASKKTRFKLTDLNFKFHENYIKFAKSELGLSVNSIGKDIKQIKTVCQDAKDHGFTINENALSRNFNSPKENTIFTTLNETELDQISEFVGSDYLMNAKDWLIIGCWTGCRVGDLMNLNKNNVLTHTSGNKIIQYTQSKTGKTVAVPMHPNVESILNQRNGFPRPISDVKFNKYIKEVCKKVGLTQKIEGVRQNPKTHKKEHGYFEKWELIRSHTCRRSFATNHYDKLDNKSIMAVTGHATEQMLLKYIGQVDSGHTEKFFDLWAREKQIEPIKLKAGKGV